MRADKPCGIYLKRNDNDFSGCDNELSGYKISANQ